MVDRDGMEQKWWTETEWNKHGRHRLNGTNVVDRDRMGQIWWT